MIPDHLLIEAITNSNLEFPINPPMIADTHNQIYLKVVAILNQGYMCLCGKPLEDGELHHALVTRREVMGMKDQDFIHDSRNVLVLHRWCHINASRSECYKFLSHIFGEKEIIKWYRNFQ